MKAMLQSMIAGEFLISLGAIAVSTFAHAGVCPTAPTPLTNYIGFGAAACTVFDKTFSFPLGNAIDSATAGLAQAGQVNVTPVGAVSDPGLQFNGAFSVPPGVNPADIVLQFTVTAPANNAVTDTTSSLTPGSPAGTVRIRRGAEHQVDSSEIGGYWRRRRMASPIAARALLNSANVAGSGIRTSPPGPSLMPTYSLFAGYGTPPGW
jgi:hypothetical protein